VHIGGVVRSDAGPNLNSSKGGEFLRVMCRGLGIEEEHFSFPSLLSV
jgi:hypothetical protein